MAGEANWMVPSLSLPDPRRLPPTGELARYEAVRLFVERAMAANAGFALTERRTRPAVARRVPEVGRHTAGHRACGGEDEGADGRADLREAGGPFGAADHGRRTAAPRHQTLRATLQWSYELLERAGARVARPAFGVRRGLGPGGGRGGGGGESRLEAGLVVGSALGAGGQVAGGGGGGSGGRAALQDAGAGQAVRARKARRERGGAGSPAAARRALSGSRRDGRTRAVGARSRTVAAAAADRVREPARGRSRGRWSPVKRKSAHGCGCGSWPRCGGSGTCRVSRKANGGYRRRWRKIPEGSPPPGPRRSEGSALSSSSSETTHER